MSYLDWYQPKLRFKDNEKVNRKFWAFIKILPLKFVFVTMKINLGPICKFEVFVVKGRKTWIPATKITFAINRFSATIITHYKRNLNLVK